VWAYIIAVPNEHYSLRFTNMANEAQVRSLPATHGRRGGCEAKMPSDRLRRAGRTSWWKSPSPPLASSGVCCGMQLQMTSCLEPGVLRDVTELRRKVNVSHDDGGPGEVDCCTGGDARVRVDPY
jgi:hypothetical protein